MMYQIIVRGDFERWEALCMTRRNWIVFSKIAEENDCEACEVREWMIELFDGLVFEGDRWVGIGIDKIGVLWRMKLPPWVTLTVW